jgi:hypothetical protein
MMDKNSFLAKFRKTEFSLEYEITEEWLDKNIEPKMAIAAKNDETSYEFIVNVEEINPSMIRKVLSEKGYGVLWWPVGQQPGELVKQMKIKVLW